MNQTSKALVGLPRGPGWGVGRKGRASAEGAESSGQVLCAQAWKPGSQHAGEKRGVAGDPMDCSPPGSSIHGIFQARVLEWGAIAFSVNVTK